MDKIVKKLRKPSYTTMITAFFCGLLIHFFGLVNILHNHDSIYRVPTGYGTGIPSGRWFLTVLGDLNETLFGGYNLAWVNGILFIAILALSAGLIVEIFKIKECKSAVLIGLCMVSFPAVASTLFYRFTSPYYGIAIFLAIFAAFVIKRYNYKFAFPMAVLSVAFSMGIYQAYASFTIAIFVILLLKLCLDDQTTLKKITVTGIYYMLILLLGFVVYFLLMKLSLVVYNVSLVDYKGISTMGVFSVGKIPELIKSAFLPIAKLYKEDYNDLAQTKLVRFGYLLIGLICAIKLVFLFIKKRIKTLNIICALLFCLLIPIAVNFVVFMCDTADIYTLMLFPIAIILFLPIVLGNILPLCDGKLAIIKKVLKKCTAIILIVIVCSYSYQANVNYSILYYNNQQITNYYNRMITQVQMTPGYDTEKEWIFIGKVNDPLLPKSWNKVNHYGGNLTTKTLINSRRTSWMKQYLGINVPLAKESDKEKVMETEVVKNMPCWPNEGSIEIVDNFVVIKLSETIK